ncbi:hypothetical protein GGR54DRAFT_412756 [Hypoxylon sp. NC1633]|nr:hypothetical protein GGR54DRAFT_412756 [Hypoxylon sp. NC1633]
MPSSSYSIHSRAATATLGGYARKMSIAPKPSMDIHIDNHYSSKVYTTGSEVTGHVTICPYSDVRFDIVQIVLLGISKTRVDAVNIPQATSHTFLKLTMPIPDSSYPVPRVYEAGMVHKVPFTFVIPSTLTLNACNHSVANDSIQEHHVRLPPTVGSWEKDDFSPDMSRIQYAVKARVYREEDKAGGFRDKVMEASQEIKVLPTVPEDAPLNITEHDDMYAMSKTKTLRKTILSPKSGKVTITAAQPGAAMLSPDGKTITSTTVPLAFEFVPTSSDARPPKVTDISTKVTAVTYYSTGGINHYPNMKNRQRTFGTSGRGSYSGTTSASTGSAGDVRWTRYLAAQARRDSGYGSDSYSLASSDEDHAPAPTPSTALITKTTDIGTFTRGSSSPVYHTAHLKVPVHLPIHKKTFVSTFHSCISSRVYILWVTVSLASGGASAQVTLGVPLQVGVQSPHPQPQLYPRYDSAGLPLPPSFDEVEGTDADAYLRPRVLGVPDVEFCRSAALPGYADLDVRRRSVAAR